MTKVGQISSRVVQLLNIPIQQGENIYLGKSNIEHMKSSHPNDFRLYGNRIKDILKNPDFVGLNKKDNSIEYVKEFKVNSEYVKVAVRVSNTGNYYARSLYVLNSNRVQNFINKGTLKRY